MSHHESCGRCHRHPCACVKSPKWDIRTEIAEVFMTFAHNALAPAGPGLRVKYRKFGSRGRFKSFVLVDKVPADLQAVVDAYEAKAT
jgi:hypothetical protein